MGDYNPMEGNASRREVMVERLVLRGELGLIRAAGWMEGRGLARGRRIALL